MADWGGGRNASQARIRAGGGREEEKFNGKRDLESVDNS